MDNTRMGMTPDDPFEDEWAAPTPYGGHGIIEQAASDDSHEVHPVHQDESGVPQQRLDDNQTPRPRQHVRLTDSQRMPPPPKPTTIRTLSIRSEDMRKESLNQRAEADAAFKAHQTMRSNLQDAVDSHQAATAKLKAVERQVVNKRMNNSLLEAKLNQQISDIAKVSYTSIVYNVLYDAILIKIDDLENDQEALHGLELDLVENLKVVSQMEVGMSRVRLAELRSKLRARRAELQVVERDAQVSAVESALEDWVGLKTWASRNSSVECSRLEQSEFSIDSGLEGHNPPSKRRRQTSIADPSKVVAQDVSHASPKPGTLKRSFSRILTDLPGYFGVFGGDTE